MKIIKHQIEVNLGKSIEPKDAIVAMKVGFEIPYERFNKVVEYTWF